MSERMVSVYTANGRLHAETVRLFLEANGIAAEILQESAGSTYGLTVGPLGEVDIYVPEHQVEEAERLLEAMENGELIDHADETGALDETTLADESPQTDEQEDR